MSREDRDERSSADGTGRPVWMQIAIGLVMAAVVLAALYVLFGQLL